MSQCSQRCYEQVLYQINGKSKQENIGNAVLKQIGRQDEPGSFVVQPLIAGSMMVTFGGLAQLVTISYFASRSPEMQLPLEKMVEFM